MAKKSTQQPTLEASLEEVTQLIDKMEHGELTLEQSLAQFERGVILIKHCQKMLEEAEQKVQLLIQKNNQDTLTLYDDEDGKHDEND